MNSLDNDTPSSSGPGEQRITGIELLHSSCTELLSQARRTVDLMSNELDASLYNRQPFLEQVKRLALSSHQSRIRILLQDNTRVQREGHRLVELVRQLPSNIEIRTPAEIHKQLRDELLIADRAGYFRRNQYQRHTGFFSLNNRLQAEHHSRQFDAIWAQAIVDSDLRRFLL